MLMCFDRKLNSAEFESIAEAVTGPTVYGDVNLWQLLYKNYCDSPESVTKTEVLSLPIGVVLKVTTKNNDFGSVTLSESLEYLPGIKISNLNGIKKLVKLKSLLEE